MTEQCKHGRLTSFHSADDGEPVGLWACAFCSRKFVPLDLAMEKDAQRYRWMRDSESGHSTFSAAYINADSANAIDAWIDGAMERERASGAA